MRVICEMCTKGAVVRDDRKAVSRRLTTRISLLIAAVVALSVVVYASYNSQALLANTEAQVLGEARTLNLQMQAVWSYVDQAQDSINYNSDGRFDFKGIYCSIAGKSIAQNFTRSSEGYMIRYAREDPRSYTDVPDAFESAALEAFATQGATEYYEMTEYDGKLVFRYASALEMKRNCLECHGGPKGEYDIVGFAKEGMGLGDLAGAVSIVIPLDTYRANMQARSSSDILFYVWLVVAVALAIYVALRVWVARPLTKMNRELMAANEASSTFLTTMSHEMRTPISAIMAYTDLIEGENAGANNAAGAGAVVAGVVSGAEASASKSIGGEASSDVCVGAENRSAEYLREIRENSRQLLDMVNNVIDAARIEANAFTVSYDEVDVADLAHGVVAMVEPLAAQRDIEVRLSVENVPVLCSDWDALFKMLGNLAGNAVKFSRAGDVVEVRLWYCRDAAMLHMEVSDTGIGISEDQLERIFEKFAQAPSAGHDRSGGSGLGLFLVKALAETMGGTISVHSQLGRGSTFSVSVPARLAGCLSE